jgi:cyclophilin family peptidyl-prolyl cis-trans isomerase
MPYKLKSSARRGRRNKKIAIVAAVLLLALIIGGGAFYFLNQPKPAPVVQGSVLLEVKGWNTTNPEQVGNITILLRDDKPVTSSHFKGLVEQGLYDNTTFFRVIQNFMIQGGHIDGVASILDEIGSNNSNVRGTVAMANGGANTAASDFFINTVDNSGSNRYAGFDTSYTVFGTVTQGMDIVDAISHVPVDNTNPDSPKPLQDVTIVAAIALP